jgi:phospholipid/cholesterol/gamma-HCH transport system substrate-binding protein
MADQFKNMMIGIFVIAAFAIIIFIMLFLHPNIGNEGKTLRVRFSDIDKISTGTRVTFAGKPIGEVLKIEEIDAGERVDHNGIVYIYELTLAIDSGINVYETDEITSRTSGLLGEKSVSISPMIPKEGEKLIPLTSEMVIYSNETGSVESTLKEFQQLSDKVEVALDGLIDSFNKIRDQKIWEHAGSTISNIDEMVADLKKTRFIDHVNSIVKNFDEASSVLNQPNKLASIFDNITATSQKAMNIFTKIENGEGSIGKILIKDDFYLRLASLMSKAEVILNDVNHYGVLFHLDKGWQRLRARRLNLLASLSTPQEFRNYFNDEIDSISVTLERVSMVVEEIDSLPCQTLWQNPEYIKVYAELLRRVATLEEYLQMYNQQVVDSSVSNTEFINCEN